MTTKPIETIISDLNGEIESYKKVLSIKDTEIKNLKFELNKVNKLYKYQQDLSESLRSKMTVYSNGNERLQKRIAELEMALSQRKKNWIQRFLGI